MARYRIIHDTEYSYGAPVSLSRQQVHLTPREVAWQRCISHRLEIEPRPTLRQLRTDAFGNPVTLLAFETPHEMLRVCAETTVDVLGHSWGRGGTVFTPPWETIRANFAYRAGRRPDAALLAAARYRFESPYGRIKHEFAAYAAPCFPPGAPLLDCVRALTTQLYRDLVFDPKATTVATPVTEVLAKRRGVCQDFAHLMISCLRSLGLAARYVSGYILTTPPPGKTRLIGADASHAWVSVWCSDDQDGAGFWIDADPTNNLLPDRQHVTVGWGRDFGDVSPLRGVILGGGKHELEVRVTMLPLDELPLT
ncbi:MAG: transglutaminase family protein [Janthinobacterium lividum]